MRWRYLLDLPPPLPPLPPPMQKNRSLKDMSQEEQHVYKEQRRQSHISAEQKRRGNIKHGFDRLQAMVIKMTPPSAGKMSKASVLLKSESCLTHRGHTASCALLL